MESRSRLSASSALLLSCVLVATAHLASCSAPGSATRADRAPSIHEPARIVFHARSHTLDRSEIDRAICEAVMFAKRNPEAKIVLLVEDPRAFDYALSAARAREIMASGHAVETVVPNVWGQRPSQPLPEGVRVISDVYLRIRELTQSGWTYVAM